MPVFAGVVEQLAGTRRLIAYRIMALNSEIMMDLGMPFRAEREGSFKAVFGILVSSGVSRFRRPKGRIHDFAREWWACRRVAQHQRPLVRPSTHLKRPWAGMVAWTRMKHRLDKPWGVV